MVYTSSKLQPHLELELDSHPQKVEFLLSPVSHQLGDTVNIEVVSKGIHQLAPDKNLYIGLFLPFDTLSRIGIRSTGKFCPFLN